MAHRSATNRIETVVYRKRGRQREEREGDRRKERHACPYDARAAKNTTGRRRRTGDADADADADAKVKVLLHASRSRCTHGVRKSDVPLHTWQCAYEPLEDVDANAHGSRL